MIILAQLVKLYDYISRYETNPFHYPSQYVHYKQENWKKLKNRWEQELRAEVKAEDKQQEQPKKINWNPFKRQRKQVAMEDLNAAPELPKTVPQLKQHFLNKLFPVQMKWATSTITQESFTKVSLKDTEVLKFFLQRFPDIYLVMYYPVFNIRNTPIDGEIILISPFDIEIIHLINQDSDTTIIATDDRKWTLETAYEQETILSPVISLKRTEQIIKSILNAQNIEMPVNKSIVSEGNHILFSTEPYQTRIIGKQDYDEWFEAKRGIQSSLKSVQLKAMSALLHQCQTSAVRRPEWKNEQMNSEPNEQEER